jgi:hypothetical protein
VSGALPGTLYAFVMVSALRLLMWRLRESLLALLPLVLALAWTNPNSPPDATPESASAENHSPETATEAGQPISCSAPASTLDAQDTRVRRGGFATRMVKMSGQPRRNAPLNGLRTAASRGMGGTGLARGPRGRRRGESILRHPDQSLVAARACSPFRLSVRLRSGPGRPQRGLIVRRKAERR